MEALRQVKLESLEPYRHLFPAAKATDDTIKKGATVSDTVDFIPTVVKSCAWQVEKFVNQELKGLPTYAACEKLWNWVKYHIKYQKDQRGLEQVRSPRRLVHDGIGDCDCFTTFIGTCLYVLKVPVINRITKYKENYFQHIYPVVPLGNGKEIIMDCVVDRFNYEEPYSEKKDFKMDLQFLDGIDDDGLQQVKGIDAQDLFGLGDFGELGKLLKKSKPSGGIQHRRRNPFLKKKETAPGAPAKKGLFKKPLIQKKPAAAKKPEGKKLKNVAKKVLNKVNKVNPATVLLRAGILASMKLNVLKVAEKLKWAYLSKEEAGKRGMDVSKYDKLKNILTKTEGIFYAAGGKPENLKKAILTGHGNRNHEVSGTDGFGDYTPLQEMLGAIYQDEFVSGMDGFEGLGELGEPATAASIAAASTAMGSLAALLKSIGDLFPKKKQKAAEAPAANESEPTVETSSEESESPESETESPAVEETENLPAPIEETETAIEESVAEENMDEGTNGKPAKKSTRGQPQNTGIKLFWEKNKTWIKPVGIGVLVASACVAGYKMMGSNREPPRQPSYPVSPGLSGFRRKKKNKKRGKKKSRFEHKSKIALM